MKAIVALVLFAGLVAASRVALEPARTFTTSWSPSAHAVDKSQDREVIIALKGTNRAEMERRFWAYSDPKSAEYGKSMTPAEIGEAFGATPAAVSAVTTFLASHGVKAELNANKDMMVFTAPLSTLEKLFAVSFKAYKHVSGRRTAATAGPYTIPAAVAEHVAFVSGVVGTPTMHKRRAAGVKVEPQQAQPWWMARKNAVKGERAFEEAPKAAPGVAGFRVSEGAMSTTSVFNPGDEMITPQTIRTAYQIPNWGNGVGSDASNLQAVAEFQGQYYSASDLHVFFSRYVNWTNITTIEKVIGYNMPNEYVGIEANLDTQYIMGVGSGIETWFYSMANFDFFHDLTKWIFKLNNDSQVPWVNSVSYGEQGNYPAAAYRERLDEEFQKAGLRRLSIVFASGDYGSGCIGGGGSFSNPSKNSYTTTTSLYTTFGGSSHKGNSYTSYTSGGRTTGHGDSTSYTSYTTGHGESTSYTSYTGHGSYGTYGTSFNSYGSYNSYGTYDSSFDGGMTTTMQTGGSTMTKGSFTTTTGGTSRPTATSTTAATTSNRSPSPVTSSYGESCSGVTLNPSFPATSIYVTAVGATRFITDNSGEQGSVIQFKSGGGFDPLFPRPAYQAAAVEAYLKSGVQMPPASAFNSSNRANPDVSALGAINFQVIVHGSPIAVGGTSCSAPTFSGIISLLNGIQFANNQPALGFLNNWIYQNPQMFTDIVKGNSVCEVFEGGDMQALVPGHPGDWCGFYVTTGWDPVTGLGTPIFPAMIAALPNAKL